MPAVNTTAWRWACSGLKRPAAARAHEPNDHVHGEVHPCNPCNPCRDHASYVMRFRAIFVPAFISFMLCHVCQSCVGRCRADKSASVHADVGSALLVVLVPGLELGELLAHAAHRLLQLAANLRGRDPGSGSDQKVQNGSEKSSGHGTEERGARERVLQRLEALLGSRRLPSRG